MSDWDDEELDRQLAARHRHGGELARQVEMLFEQLWRAQDPQAALQHELLEQSLHATEVAFSLRSGDEAKPWRIFPKIFLTSGTVMTVEMRLFYNTQEGAAVAESYASPESFVAALVHRARMMADGAPELRLERRVFARQTVDLPTTISTPDRALRLHATVINRSRAGVMVELLTPAELPKVVRVLLDGTQHDCTVIWQDGERAGLAFMTPLPAHG